MRLDTRAFGLAAGTVAAILYLICAAAIAVAPGPTTTLAGYLIHADLSTMPRVVTAGGFIVGFAVWTFGTAVVFAAIAAVYNRLLTGLVGSAVPLGRQVPA